MRASVRISCVELNKINWIKINPISFPQNCGNSGALRQQRSQRRKWWWETSLWKWANILPRGTLTSHDTCEATTTDSTNNLVSANITAMSSPESRGMKRDDPHTRAVMRVPRWKQKKKTEKRTITRRTARWATSKLSRGRIQPYIGVDTVPRSYRGNAQSNAPLGATCEWKKKEGKKRKKMPRHALIMLREIMNREMKMREFSRFSNFVSDAFRPAAAGDGSTGAATKTLKPIFSRTKEKSLSVSPGFRSPLNTWKTISCQFLREEICGESELRSDFQFLPAIVRVVYRLSRIVTESSAPL